MGDLDFFNGQAIDEYPLTPFVRASLFSPHARANPAGSDSSDSSDDESFIPMPYTKST